VSEQLKILRENTDRRFAILMTAMQDFMAAFQQERNEKDALLGIQAKALKATTPTPTKKKKKKKNEETKKRPTPSPARK